MREEKTTIQIYNFDELSENIKNRLIQDERQQIIDTNFNYILDDFSYYLERNYNIKNVNNYYYDLSYSQGDYVSFNLDNDFINLHRLIGKKDINIFEKKLIESLTKAEFNTLKMYLDYGYNFKYELRFYSCSQEYKIIYEYFYFNDLKIEDYINQTIDKISNFLNKINNAICFELKQIGYKCYDVEDSEIIDNLKEFEYLSNGEVYQ